MASEARKAFDKNLGDIDRLLEFHKSEAGESSGRKYNLEVLNKSAIVLITAFWEAYCEDIAAEALEHILNNANSSDDLPKELKKQISKSLKKAENELSVWEVADQKWKDYIRARLDEMTQARDRKLNTPKSDNIDLLFLDALGISKVSSSWRWDKKMTVERARDKLDKFVELRGSVAHRGCALESVKKAQVTDYLGFIKKLAAKTGGKVNSHVKDAVGTPLWTTSRGT